MSSSKKILFFPILFLLTSFGSPARAQSQSPAQSPAQAQDPMQTPLDSIQLRTLKGAVVSYGVLARKTPIILVCFWSVNSDPSINELNAIHKQYEKWKGLASFKLMAVCVDQGNLLNRMRSTANSNEWRGFDVCADINGDLQKALRFNNLPQAVILKNGQALYQQSGFEAGTENYLFSKIQELSAGRK
jgi:hypothetical protein